MEIKLPEAVSLILNRLEESGYEAYVVGGCVRDSIMGIPPHDWDICTSALPDQIISIFSDQKVIPTGLKHGTVTVVIDNCEYEITTFRQDGKYTDNRHPDSVGFTRNLKEDLMRRDFTINALAYSTKSGIIDCFNGIDDIQNKIIRCVGNPDERFSEDALRIIRAVRFAVRFGFEIERKTKIAMMLRRDLLSNISVERINSELEKTIMCDLREKESLLYDFIFLLSVVVPEFNRLNPWTISLRLVDSSEIFKVRLALLFDFNDVESENVLKRLRFSNDIVKSVVTIQKYGRNIKDNHSQWSDTGADIDENISLYMYNKTDYFERKLLHDISYQLALLAIDYARAFAKEDGVGIANLKDLESRVDNAFLNGEPYCLSDLEINGNDLNKLGYSGKQIGKVLNTLLDMVMRDTVMNDHDKLIRVAKSIKENLL